MGFIASFALLVFGLITGVFEGYQFAGMVLTAVAMLVFCGAAILADLGAYLREEIRDDAQLQELKAAQRIAELAERRRKAGESARMEAYKKLIEEDF